jgi:ABC-type antimicrobial peptide transport system permease subunit
VGVVKDFHPNVPFEKIPPFIMLAHNEQIDQFNMYSIRLREGADPAETRNYIDEVFASFFPDALFESRFMNDGTQNNTFQIYEAVTSTFGFFSIITSIISIVGLFGLVAYVTQSRTKEIGIRKVHGASPPQLFLILVKDFLVTIGIAILIAWPLGSMIRSLDPAYYKVPVNFLEYGFTALMVILITLITVSFHTFKVAKGNPIEALRYE